jgi:hypothetical protein
MDRSEPPPAEDGLATSLEFGYALTVGGVLRAAAAALRGSKRVVLAGAAAWLGVTWLVGAVTLALGLGELVAASLGVLATTPLTLGLLMVGVRRARGEDVALGDLLAHRGATAQGAIVLLANLLVLNATEAILGPVWSTPVVLAYGCSPRSPLPRRRPRHGRPEPPSRRAPDWCATAGPRSSPCKWCSGSGSRSRSCRWGSG